MITLKQARKVRNGTYLSQEDVDAINQHAGSDYDKLKTCEDWAHQYKHDEWAEGERANQFHRDTY